jgi:hypothetical protein
LYLFKGKYSRPAKAASSMAEILICKPSLHFIPDVSMAI